MLDQQVWCWGQDIRIPLGNGLIQYGFDRHPVTPGLSGSTGYARRDEANRLLALWGSGLFLGAPDLGGVVLRRFNFQPAYTERSSLIPSELSGGAVPTFLARVESPGPAKEAELVGLVLDAIVTYERWVLDELGLDHRRRCVAAWPKACVTAEEMVPAWESLARCWRAIGIRAAS